jgi:hypothetical protein
MGDVIILADETQATLMVLEKKNNLFQASWHNIVILWPVVLCGYSGFFHH